MMNNIKEVLPHPNRELYLKQFASIYEDKNYNSGLVGYFLKKSHEWSELQFKKDMHFAKVLEVGAGTGMHIKYVHHSFDEYVLTDINTTMIDRIKISQSLFNTGKISILKEDATNLSFKDNTFDSLIAAHVLEHIYHPYLVLQEWVRVLKPRGILTLVLPCDPGFLWRLGRFAIARKKIIKTGLLYDYWMAREHVNPINCLISFVRYYFKNIKEEWYPFHVPSMDINLFYIVHIRI